MNNTYRRTSAATVSVLAALLLMVSFSVGQSDQQVADTQDTQQKEVTSDGGAVSSPVDDTGPQPVVGEYTPHDAQHIDFTEPGPKKTGFARASIILIEGGVELETQVKVFSSLIDRAVENGAEMIIFEMKTPGSVTYYGMTISKLIKSLPEVHTVAWVHPEAYSGGSLISLACDEVVVSARSSIGASQQIMMGPQGPSTIPEELRPKFNSPLLEEFRDSARRNGYNQLMVESIVEPDLEVFWVVNIDTGEKRFVDRNERDMLFGLTSAAATQAARDGGDRHADERSKTAWRYVRSHSLLGEVRQPIVADDELLTMSQDEALAYGFATTKIISEDQFVEKYAIAEAVARTTDTWSERLVIWLTSPLVRGVFFMLMLLGAYVEFNTPGIGVGGIVALVALAIFLGAPYLTGLANVIHIVLVVLGLALIAVEIFLIPGIGIAGFLGGLLVLAGLLGTYVPQLPDQSPWDLLPAGDYAWDAFGNGVLSLAGGLVGALVLGVLFSKNIGKVPYARQMVAPNPEPGTQALEEPVDGLLKAGQRGVSVTALRPAGKARFDAIYVDVVTDGAFVDNNRPVEVVQVSGNRVVVRAV